MAAVYTNIQRMPIAASGTLLRFLLLDPFGESWGKPQPFRSPFAGEKANGRDRLRPSLALTG